MSASYSGRLRSRSVSSMRSAKMPCCWRAKSTLYNAVEAVPRCAKPVGLGAMRTRTVEGPGTAICYGRAWSARVGRRQRVQPRQRGAGQSPRRRCRPRARVRRADRRCETGPRTRRRACTGVVSAVRPRARGAPDPEACSRQFEGVGRPRSGRRILLPGRRRPRPRSAGSARIRGVARHVRRMARRRVSGRLFSRSHGLVQPYPRAGGLAQPFQPPAGRRARSRPEDRCAAPLRHLRPPLGGVAASGCPRADFAGHRRAERGGVAGRNRARKGCWRGHGGRGSPVVFIHGLGSSSYMEWRYNLEPTGARHRVFALVLPGYGRTENPRARYSIPYFARFVERYIEDRALRSAAIVGASLGGRVALELALERPQLARKLVLVNTLGLGRPQVRMAQMAYGLVTIPRVGEAAMRFARGALQWASPSLIRRVAARYAGATSDLERAMDDAYLKDLRELYATDEFHNAYLSTVRSLVNPRALFGGHHDVTTRLNEIKMPLQLIWGADDPLFPVAHATRAHSLVEHSRLAVIEGAGHSPQAERPEEFNRVLLDFLAS